MDQPPCQHCNSYSDLITSTLARWRIQEKVNTYTSQRFQKGKTELASLEASSIIEELVDMWWDHLLSTHQGECITGMTVEALVGSFHKFRPN